MSALTIAFMIWYIIGLVSFFTVAKKIAGSVDRLDILIGICSSFIGPLIPLIILLLDTRNNDFWNKKVF